MTLSDKRGRVVNLFISYARVDKPQTEDWITKHLRIASHDVWIDDRIEGGQNWRQVLLEKISSSDAVLFVMTPESVQSESCEWEIEQALLHNKPIIPIRLQAETPIPDNLKHLQAVDFTKGATPEAVKRLLSAIETLRVTPVTAPYRHKGKAAWKSFTNIARVIAALFSVVVGLAAIFSVLPQRTQDEFFVWIGLITAQPPTATITASPAITMTPLSITIAAIPISSTATLGFTETAFPINTVLPTETPSPTSTDRPAIPATALPASPTAPTPTTAAQSNILCEARIVASSAQVLTIVRAMPSSRSPATVGVVPGEAVVVVATSRENSRTVWYQIARPNAQTLGWIDPDDLELSSECPQV
jgi:hypothetical protein